jgi:hypothetical protein
MSNYWKQSLIIGGFYWIVSLFLKISGIWWIQLIDLSFSIVLLLGLIAFNWILPIKKIDTFINKHPVISTMIVSWGWMPYYSAVLFLIAAVTAVSVYLGTSNIENIVILLTITKWAADLGRIALIVIISVVLFLLFVKGKSIAGQLDNSYKLGTSSPKETKKDADVETKQNVEVAAKTKPAPKKVVSAKTKNAKKVTAEKQSTKKVSKTTKTKTTKTKSTTSSKSTAKPKSQVKKTSSKK